MEGEQNIKIKELRDKLKEELNVLEDKYKPLYKSSSSEQIDKITNKEIKEQQPFKNEYNKKNKEIKKKYEKLIEIETKKYYKVLEKLDKQDFEKELLDMLILSLKKLIIKDKTITYNEKENKFLVDIDGDVNKMTPTEMIEAFIYKYNEVNSTKYSDDVKVNDEEFIKYYMDKKGIKKTGSGKTASVAMGAGGFKTASVVEGRGIMVVDVDKSNFYNIPRRFL